MFGMIIHAKQIVGYVFLCITFLIGFRLPGPSVQYEPSRSVDMSSASSILLWESVSTTSRQPKLFHHPGWLFILLLLCLHVLNDSLGSLFSSSF